MTSEGEHTVDSVGRALTIVDTVIDDGPVTASEVARTLEMPVSTVHNHLATLTEAGYVVRNGDSYRPSLRFLDAGSRVRSDLPLYRAGVSTADDLATETGELVNLTVAERGRGVHVYQAWGMDAVAVDTHEGSTIPLHATASGKAILARESASFVDTVVERGLSAETDNTLTSESALRNELDQVRENGYAVDDEERLSGFRCVAAPVVTQTDEVLGAISVSGPTRRIDGDRLYETLPAKVMEAADVIGIEASYADQP